MHMQKRAPNGRAPSGRACSTPALQTNGAPAQKAKPPPPAAPSPRPNPQGRRAKGDPHTQRRESQRRRKNLP